MKKLFLFAAVAVLGLSACDNSALTGFSTTKQATKLVRANDDDWGIHRVYDEKLQDCVPPAVNCFDDIIVIGNLRDVSNSKLRNFISLVREGDSQTIVTFAENNYEHLNGFMLKTDIDGVIEGNLHPTSLTNKEGKVFLFLQEGGANGKLVKVYPVINK
jgi:hypothetical protein